MISINKVNRQKWIGCGVLIALIISTAIIIGVAVPKGGKSSEGETTTTIKPTKTINFTNVEFEPEVTINEDENEGNDEDKVNGITGSPETEAPETEVPEAEVPETEVGCGSVVQLLGGLLGGLLAGHIHPSTTVFTGEVATGMFCASTLL